MSFYFMEISVLWCLGILQSNMNLRNHMFTPESKYKILGKNYDFINISVLGYFTFF